MDVDTFRRVERRYFGVELALKDWRIHLLTGDNHIGARKLCHVSCACIKLNSVCDRLPYILVRAPGSFIRAGSNALIISTVSYNTTDWNPNLVDICSR